MTIGEEQKFLKSLYDPGAGVAQSV